MARAIWTLCSTRATPGLWDRHRKADCLSRGQVFGGGFVSWHEYIHGGPSVLAGKAEGWTVQEILENYPQLSQESLRAVFAFALECTRDELVHIIRDG